MRQFSRQVIRRYRAQIVIGQALIIERQKVNLIFLFYSGKRGLWRAL